MWAFKIDFRGVVGLCVNELTTLAQLELILKLRSLGSSYL